MKRAALLLMFVCGAFAITERFHSQRASFKLTQNYNTPRDKCTGNCQQTSTPCSVDYVPRLCAHPSSTVQCCKTAPRDMGDGGSTPTPTPPPSGGSTIGAPHPEAPGWIQKIGDSTLSYVVENLDAKNKNTRHPVKSHKPNKFLLHTIDGLDGKGDWESGITTLNKKQYWPHFIVALDKRGTLRVGQFLPMTQSVYALSGRNAGTVQVEIGGYSGMTGSHKPFTESHPQIAKAVHLLFKAVSEWSNGKIPLKMDSRIKFYNAARQTQHIKPADYEAFSGLLGHQHVPGEDHGDPGPICGSFIVTGKPCNSVAASAGGEPDDLGLEADDVPSSTSASTSDGLTLHKLDDTA